VGFQSVLCSVPSLEKQQPATEVTTCLLVRSVRELGQTKGLVHQNVLQLNQQFGFTSLMKKLAGIQLELTERILGQRAAVSNFSLIEQGHAVG